MFFHKIEEKLSKIERSLDVLLMGQKFFQQYLLIKQRFGILVPAEAYCVGTKFEVVKIALKDLKCFREGNVIPYC